MKHTDDLRTGVSSAGDDRVRLRARRRCRSRDAQRCAAGSASAVPAEQLVERRHLAGARRSASASFISFIGTTRRLHPDFGGEASPGSVEIYGFPYIVVDGSTAEASGAVRVLG